MFCGMFSTRTRPRQGDDKVMDGKLELELDLELLLLMLSLSLSLLS